MCSLCLHIAVVLNKLPSSPPAMFCLRTSHSFPPSQTGSKHCYCEARGFSPKNPFKMATILPGLEIGERYMKAQVSSIHKLYTVKKKKKTPQLLPKYAELTGMLYGALSERTKKAQSDSFSPALPHPHIISWKIPDICCNFFFFFFALVQARL